MSDTQKEIVRRDYTEEEIAHLHELLSTSVGKFFELEEKKAAEAAQHNTAIKAAKKDMADIQTKLERGYEEVEVEVVEAMDRPEPGMKQIVRADTGKVLRTVPMSPREKQMVLWENTQGIEGEPPEARPEG